MESYYIVLIIIISLLIIFTFSEQIIYLIETTKNAFVSIITDENPQQPEYQILPDEGFNNPKLDNAKISNQTMSMADQNAISQGYTGKIPWDEQIALTELDPGMFQSQADFVKDVRRFSSTSSFTSVADDNTNSDFTNFVGLRRPEAIPNMIGGTARQIPDINETVLTRNKILRWNSTS